MSVGETRLEAAAWSALLTAMGDSEAAQAETYEALRVRLVAFFRYKGWSHPDELVDETLDRVAQKLVEEPERLTTELGRYALGVARYVHLEGIKREDRRRRSLATAAPEEASVSESVERERRHAALEKCLGALSEEDRRLLRRYHTDRGQTKIDARRVLAEELGVTMNALRLKTFRLRGRVEKCVRDRLAPKRIAAGGHRGVGASGR